MANRTIKFPRYALNQTPATIRDAYDAPDNTKPITENARVGEINISGILTRIIQDCGRFVERYASDALYSIDTIRTLCECRYPIEEPIDEIFCFGFRMDGVDHNAYILKNLYDSRRPPYNDFVFATPYYRRILAVRVKVEMEDNYPRLTCELKNITHKFHSLNKADLTESGNLIMPPYTSCNPTPVPRVIRTQNKPKDKKNDKE